MTDELERILFKPSGIAVVGASQDPSKLGYALARNLVESAYPGCLHFVNPRGGTLFDRPIYPEISSVPDPVDLAVLLIPAPAVPQTIRQCGQRGIRAVIIASAGFKETGAEGSVLEQACLVAAKETGISLVGPNCVGLIDTHLPMNATFLMPPGPVSGELALISQSGAFCAMIIDWSRGQGLGFSRLVSLGNQADLNESDFLEMVAADPATKVITFYLEGMGNGQHFLQAARRVTRQKPVLALKVGHSASGRRAVASHTGSLAGQEAAFDAAFRRCGVIRAQTSEELFDWARTLAWCPTSQGRSVAVLTNAGGPGVTAADALDACGMRLADLSTKTLQTMSSFLPAAASTHNPIDLLASATPEQYSACLSLLIDDPKVDEVMVILVRPPLFGPVQIFTPLIPFIQNSPKPVVCVLMGGEHMLPAIQALRDAHIPYYSFPERAAAGLAALAQRGEYLQQPFARPPILNDIDNQRVERLLMNPNANKQGWLSVQDSKTILAAYGIPSPAQELVSTPAQARLAASRMGLGQEGVSLALKIVSEDILHKSDIGGVMLNISTLDELESGFNTLLQRLRTSQPQADIQGVMIQHMAPPGQEVIVGVVQDVQFGPLVMFGSGGVEVEGLKDIAFGLGPLTDCDADSMLETTWAGRKLKGFRSIPSVDRNAVKESLQRLAQLAADFPQLAEIEINPLRALASGVLALDVRMRVQMKPE